MANAKHEREMVGQRIEIDAEIRRQSAEIIAKFDDRELRLQKDLANGPVARRD